MSNIKVGDRVLIRYPSHALANRRGSVMETGLHDSDGIECARVAIDGSSGVYFLSLRNLRRLVKRRKPPSADRVMVAAALMPWISTLVPISQG